MGGMVGIVCYLSGMTALQEISAEIQKRRDEIQTLELARSVLDGGSSTPTRRRRAAARTRAPRGARKEQVLAVLTDTPQGPSAIAQAVGMTPQHATRVLKQLGEDKAAKKRTKGWVKA